MIEKTDKVLNVIITGEGAKATFIKHFAGVHQKSDYVLSTVDTDAPFDQLTQRITEVFPYEGIDVDSYVDACLTNLSAPILHLLRRNLHDTTYQLHSTHNPNMLKGRVFPAVFIFIENHDELIKNFASRSDSIIELYRMGGISSDSKLASRYGSKVIPAPIEAIKTADDVIELLDVVFNRE